MGVPTAGRDYTDEEIRSFVRDLESLPGGDLTVSLLVGCGARAVPPLRELLLNGKPRGVFQPRQRAVEALAELGAKDVLMEYLSQKRAIADAVVRFGEEAVENTAARELARWPIEEVFQFLMDLAQRRMLTGAVDALGQFERPEAVPVFVKALGDDVSRPSAERALRAIAGKVKPVLLQAARRASAQEDEKPSERQTRRSVIRILADMVLTEEEWNELKPLLQDGDPEIEIMTAEMAVDWAPPTEKQIAAPFLIRSLDSAHWFLQIRIQECLGRNYGVLHELIAHEANVRRRAARGEPLADPVLRILEKLQSRRK
jgi:HEAT repeat protein